jgi:hypothetical protein
VAFSAACRAEQTSGVCGTRVVWRDAALFLRLQACGLTLLVWSAHCHAIFKLAAGRRQLPQPSPVTVCHFLVGPTPHL